MFPIFTYSLLWGKKKNQHYGGKKKISGRNRRKIMYVSQGYRPLLLMHAIIKGIAAIFIHVSGALCKQMFQVRWNINQREVLTESKTT